MCLSSSTPNFFFGFLEKFNARDVQWAPDGKGLLLIDRDTFCCGFDVEE